MKLGFTGHRLQRLDPDIHQSVSLEIHKIMMQKAPEFVISGMATGVDTWAATIAIKNKIKLIAAIPYEGHHEHWSQNDGEIFLALREEATEVHHLSEPGYSAEKMHIRNRWIVDNCDELVAVWDEIPSGGTYQTVKYALSKRKKITYINPKNLQLPF